MDISNIEYDTYKIHFNVDDIQKAYELQDTILHKLNKCNLDEYELSLLTDYVLRFRETCLILIHKENIDTSELYDVYVKTLKSINSLAQNLLYSKKYKHNINIMQLKDYYNRIDKYLSFSKSPEKLFLLCLLFNSVLLVFTSIMIINLTSNNVYLSRLIPLLTIFLIILPLCFSKQIKNLLKKLSNILTYKINTHKCEYFLKKLNNIKK